MLLLAASPRRPPSYDANVTPFGGRKQSRWLFAFICRPNSALCLMGRLLPGAVNSRLTFIRQAGSSPETRPELIPDSRLARHAGSAGVVMFLRT